MPKDPDSVPRSDSGTDWVKPTPTDTFGNANEFDFSSFVAGTGMTVDQMFKYKFTNPQQVWNTWLATANADAGFAAMAKMYGNEFVQFAWDSQYGDSPMTDAEMAAEFLRRGWDTAAAIANYRGGGGGGMSRAAQIKNLEAEIRNLARTLGVPMDDAQIISTARTAVAGNWSSAMIEDYVVGSTFTDWSQLQEGFLTNTVQQIKQMANSQLVTMSDETAKEYAKRAATSEFNLSTLDSILKEQARQRYSWAAPALDAGMTMADFTRPMRDTIASELEVNPDTVDLMDAKWMDMLQTDDGGTLRAATQSEIVRRARKLPEFATTGRAAEMSASAATYLRQYLGA